MTQELALWAISIFCSLCGALMLIVLTRILKQGDDTNAKVTKQGETITRMETNYKTLDDRVTSLHNWRSELQAKALEKALSDLQEERRHNVRRESDHALIAGRE